MKKWICLWMTFLMLACTALADESALVQLDELKMQIGECRVQEQQNGAAISFAWSAETAAGVQENYFMDVGRVAVSSGGIGEWQLAEKPMEESNLVMVLLGSAGQTVGSNGELMLTGGISYPLQIAFSVDFYEAITKSASLDLRRQVWRMVRSESDGQLVEARPDLPHMNNNSNIPKVLEDFDALVESGESWEEQLNYIREHAGMCRLVAKIYALAKPLGAYEVLITFESSDQPGTVQIAEVN